MSGGYWELVGRAVDTIETNIGASITLDSIANEVGLSKFHLHRLFKALTGMGLIAYARGRKLSRSLGDLLNTNLKVIDIAVEYGFEYEQSYERAFKRQFHVSPSAFRCDRPHVPVVPIPSLADLNPLDDGVLINPVFVMKPGFHLAGIESEVVHAVNYAELTANRLARDFYYNSSRKVPGAVNSHVYYGLVRYSKRSDVSNRYMPSVETADPGLVSLPFSVFSLPTQTYAVFRYVGFHDPQMLSIRTLHEIYRFIFGVWLPKARSLPAGEYHFERIDLRICSPEYCEADIFLPVGDAADG